MNDDSLTDTLTRVRLARPLIADEAATVVSASEREAMLQRALAGRRPLTNRRPSPRIWLTAAAAISVLAGALGVWAVQQPTEIRIATPPPPTPTMSRVDVGRASLPATWDPQVAIPVFPAPRQEPPVGVDWSSPDEVTRSYLSDRLPDLFPRTGSVEVLSNDGHLAIMGWEMEVDGEPVGGTVHVRFGSRPLDQGNIVPDGGPPGWWVIAATTTSIDASSVRSTTGGLTIEATTTDINNLAADLYDQAGQVIGVAGSTTTVEDCPLCPFAAAGLAEQKLVSNVDNSVVDEQDGGWGVRLRLVGGTFLGISEFWVDSASVTEVARGIMTVDATDRPWRFVVWSTETSHCFRLDPEIHGSCVAIADAARLAEQVPNGASLVLYLGDGPTFGVLQVASPEITSARLAGTTSEIVTVPPAVGDNPFRVIGPLETPEPPFVIQFLDAEGQAIGQDVSVDGSTDNAGG